MNHRLRALLLSLLLVPAAVLAQQTAERSADYTVETGDRWIDAQLQDINHYAERYPDAFLDEVSRYADVPRGYLNALFTTHGWQAGDIYFACFWAKASAQTCRDSVRAFSQNPEGGWEAVVKRMPTRPENLHYRAVRHAIVASYRHYPVMLLCISPPHRAPATIRVRAVPCSRNRVTDERLFRFA
ncbi:hypothetical protein [Stenotrophomonas maltophilia group sp. Smal12]|uniref:hypothetical protein n=1 Tax=Stenotrophomonas maltophilia group sp. Smal12 TaxID=3050414 RepID=UPI00300EA133